MSAIESAANPRVKRLRKFFTDPATRREEGLWPVEGIRQAEEAVRAAHKGLTITECYLSADDHGPRVEALLNSLEPLGVKPVILGKAAFASFSDTVSPQGVCLLVSAPLWQPADLLAGDGPVVIVDRLREPGNLGAIFRTAAAAGAAGLLFTRGTVDPGNPKTIRASAGTIFTLPYVQAEGPGEASALIDRPLYATSGSDGSPPEELGLDGPFALVLGQEAEGLGARWSDLVDGLITIPMAMGVESLNVAAAAAVILFEAARQRRKTDSSELSCML